MLSSILEKTLRNAYQLATDSKHEFVTLEHLLNSLTNDKDAVSVLKACGVEIEQLKNNRFYQLGKESVAIAEVEPSPDIVYLHDDDNKIN